MKPEKNHTELQAHLTIVGAILESSDIYSSKRKDLLRDLVLRAIQQIEKTQVARSTDIYNLIFYKDVKFIKRGHLHQILKDLEAENIIGSIDIGSEKSYFVQTGSKRNETPLLKSLRKAYKTYVSRVKLDNFEEFLDIITTAFSSYGVTTFDNLFKKKTSTYINIESLIEEKRGLITDVPFEVFRDGVLDFFESETEDCREIKVFLAQSYMALKMMGAGNWTNDEFHELLNEKKLVIDSNVLFQYLAAEEMTGRNYIQESFKILRDTYRVSFYIAHETQLEFKRAFLFQLGELEKAFKRSVNVKLYSDNGILDLDWFDTYENFKTLNPDSSFDDFAIFIDEKISGLLKVINADVVYFENCEATSKPQAYAEKISDVIKGKNRIPKSENALKHDALAAIFLEENPEYMLFSNDSCWRHLRINGDTRYLNCGDLLMYMTIGLANSKELSHLLSHVIRENILPFKSFFSLREIESMRNFEAKIANLSRSHLRELSSTLKDLRKQKIEKGKDITNEEITREAIHYLLDMDNEKQDQDKIKELNQQLIEKENRLQFMQNESKNFDQKFSNQTGELHKSNSFIIWFIGLVVGCVILQHLTKVQPLLAFAPVVLAGLLHIVSRKYHLKETFQVVMSLLSFGLPFLDFYFSQVKSSQAQVVVVKVEQTTDEIRLRSSAPNRQLPNEGKTKTIKRE